MGTHNVTFVPNSLQVYKIYLNFFTELKMYHAFNLFIWLTPFKCIINQICTPYIFTSQDNTTAKKNEIKIFPRSSKAQSRKLTLMLVAECTELVLSLNLFAVSSFSLQKFATQLASCSPNRSHCLSDTPSTLSRLSVVDGLRSKNHSFSDGEMSSLFINLTVDCQRDRCVKLLFTVS